MAKTSIIALFILSLLWLLYAIPFRFANLVDTTRDAKGIEVRLEKWAERNSSEAALQELFDKRKNLDLSDHSEERTFSEIIDDIEDRSSIPPWPGIAGLVICLIFITDLNLVSRSSKDRHHSASMNTPTS